MTTHLYPIVGVRHHPPASAIVEFLPVGTPLRLVAEPQNAFDPNAIAIWIGPPTIWDNIQRPQAYDQLESAMLALGPEFTLDWLLQQPMIQLGYLPKEVALALKPNWSDREGHFALGGNGGPKIRFETDEKE